MLPYSVLCLTLKFTPKDSSSTNMVLRLPRVADFIFSRRQWKITDLLQFWWALIPVRKKKHRLLPIVIVRLHFFFLFLFSWGGVRLSSLGTSATNWPIVPAPDDRRWVCSSRWNENWQGKSKYSEKTCPSATLSTKNPTWPDLGSNPDRRCGKPGTNHLTYGTVKIAFMLCLFSINCKRKKGKIIPVFN
jgi:hypothetical protein